MDAVISGAAMAVGIALMLYSLWRLCRPCDENAPRYFRYQNPRHCLQRRGKICGVGGAGLLALGLAFWGSPHDWGTPVLLVWVCGVVLLLAANELLSMR